MNVWAKMLTALRGGVNEAGEAIVDSQALRILDQELRDAADEINQSKDSLAAIIARKKLSEEKATTLQGQIAEYEGYAVQALERGDEGLALEVADKVAGLEAQLQVEREAGEGFAQSAAQLQTAIKQAEQNIKRLKQQVDTVKATENVQRAQKAVAARHSGSNSKLRTAMESLERIKERQAMTGAQINAASELAESSVDVTLQQKLEQAGIAPRANSGRQVLERLKQRAQTS